MASLNAYPFNFQSDFQNYPRGYTNARPSAPLLQPYPNPDPRYPQQPYQQPPPYRPAFPANLKIEKSISRLYKLSRIINAICFISGGLGFISSLYWFNYITYQQYDANNPSSPLFALIAAGNFGVFIASALGIRAAHHKTVRAIKTYLWAFILLAICIIVGSFLVYHADSSLSSSSEVKNMKNEPDFTKANIELGNFHSSILYRGHSLPRPKPRLESWKEIKDRKWNKTIKVKAEYLEAGENENSFDDDYTEPSFEESINYAWINAAVIAAIFFSYSILGKKFLKAAKKYESLCSQNNFNFQQLIQPTPAYVLAQHPQMAVAGSRVN
ncbi:unnamed protein product [Blepharisma stoltei]|uniref:Uncharacterized protein n=1 Tax=Blepharisma stoltei TaxID=1481888 RepID=A0AAU9IHM2_9CILI|nr:unnamed protein product [Blepharisma stoltei]